MAGEIEADESYFGGTRKGKRGRGAAGKVWKPMGAALRLLVTQTGHSLHTGDGPIGPSHRNRF